MPSSRIPKTSSKTMSGAKRPFVSEKTDKRVGYPRTSVSIQEGDYRSTASFNSKPLKGMGDQVQYKSTGKGSPKQMRSVQKKLGSYAANYFKKNSK